MSLPERGPIHSSVRFENNNKLVTIEASTQWKNTSWGGREKIAILTKRQSTDEDLKATVTIISQAWYHRVIEKVLGPNHSWSSKKIALPQLKCSIHDLQEVPQHLRIAEAFESTIARISNTQGVDWQQTLESEISLHPHIVLGSGLQKKSPEDIQQRIAKHRSSKEGYGREALSKGPYSALVKTKEAAESATLQALSPIAKAIRHATIKEEACREVYHMELPDRISKGYYDPEIIPFDIEKLLGRVDNLVQPILNPETLNELLSKEVTKYQVAGKLNEHQAKHLNEDALSIADYYLKAFPSKTFQEAFFLTRDLIRVATYQEFYDKSSFNGSDHGSKHIHHNIHNASALHKGMILDSDYNAKDQFMEKLIHFYHDIGYTVGLANNDFDCCKDHPFIGAAMIEANREYFLHYLDEMSYKTLHDCILCHAIVNPDLTARTVVDGMHPGMVRSVTSISDACAVTYDRKTQEFWEQPRALVALARLKTFLVLYPQYKEKLGDDIVKGPWPGYDGDNPWDKMSFEIFLHTRQELYDMVEEYDIPLEKRGLFRQAIDQQFNAFKTNVTLGQYGAVLTDVAAVPWKDKQHDTDPDYLPQFTLAPSIMYGVLKDLFGEDQANDAFKKLVTEFNGDMKVIEAGLKTITEQVEPKEKEVKIATGTAIFHLCSEHEHDESDSHMSALQGNLKTAIGEISMVFKAQYATMNERQEIVKKLDAWYKTKNAVTFGQYTLTTLLPSLMLVDRNAGSVSPGTTDKLNLLNKFTYKTPNDTTAEEFVEIRNNIQLIFLSKEEYAFMRGTQPSVSMDELISRN